MLASTGAAAPSGPDGDQFTVIDYNRSSVQARLKAIDGSHIELERDGLADRRSSDEVMVLMRSVEPARRDNTQPDAMGLLELVDGQKWRGSFEPGKGGDDVITWNTANLHAMYASVDKVKHMTMRGGNAQVIAKARRQRDPDAIGDWVVLTNGDVLHGFVMSMGSDFEIEDANGELVRLSYANIAFVELANESTPSSGTIVWLGDGSVVRADSISWDENSLKLDPGDGPARTLSPDLLRGVVFGAHRFVPLAAMEFESRRVSNWLTWMEPPRILDPSAPGRVSDIEIQGPVELHASLPENAGSLWTTARVPRRAGAWADFVLIVEVDGREMARQVMDSTANTRAELLVDLDSGSQLVIRLEEGGRGPVSDVVVLERPVVFIGSAGR